MIPRLLITKIGDSTVTRTDSVTGLTYHILITYEDLINYSYIKSENLLNGLNSSSNLTKIQILKTCPSIEEILETEYDLKAVLFDLEQSSSTPVFTGYISREFNWNVTTSGGQALEITIEDVGTKLLGKPFIEKSSNDTSAVFDSAAYDGSATSVISRVCSRAGIAIDSNCPTIMRDNSFIRVCKVVDASTTCKQILDAVTFECGYAYYFTTSGKLSLFKIDCTTTSGAIVLDGDNLTYDSKTAIKVKRSPRRYKGSIIEATELEDRTGVRIYEDISGQSSTYPHCNIEMLDYAYYPSPDGTFSFYEVKDLDKGYEIVYIKPNTVVPTVISNGGQVTSEVSLASPKELRIRLYNNSVYTANVTQLSAAADLKSIKATSITKSGIEPESSDESDSVYRYTAEWIHEKKDTEYLANLTAQYYRYCSSSYSFQSSTDVNVGSIVRLNDDVFSSLDTYVMVIGKTTVTTSNVRKYTAIGISPFNLSGETRFRKVDKGTVAIGEVRLIKTELSYAEDDQGIDPSLVTGWQSTILSATAGNYLWTRTTYTYSDNTSTYGYSVSYVPDMVYSFALKVTPTSIIQNRRLTSSQSITATCEIEGYTGTPTISYYYGDSDPETAVEFVALNATFSIPYDQSHSSLIVKATLTGAPTQTVELNAVDDTDEFRYFGTLSIDTSDYFDNGVLVPNNYSLIDWSDTEGFLNPNEKFIEGDSFFNNFSETGFTDVYIYVYEHERWIPISFSNLTNGDRSIICSQAMNDVLSTIETGSVTKSDFGYFNTIITETITADYIGGKEIEVQSGGFVYGGDVDITQPAGQRLGSSGAGFCFDSNGNAEMSNIRISGNSTIEGGSTVLGTLINYDSNQKPVFKTVKESTANVSIAGSKVDGTSAPAAYLWNSFYQWLKNAIISNATSGTYYSASSSTINGTWSSGSISSQSVIGIKYWSSVPTTASTTTVNGSRGAGTSETKEMYRNPNSYYVTFNKILCHPKTDHQTVTGQTGYGTLKCTTYYSNGTVYQVFCNSPRQESTHGAGLTTVYSVKVPPGGYIVAEAQPYGDYFLWQDDTDLYLQFTTKESDMFSSGINFITSNGQIYAYDNVIPSTSTYSTYSQTLTCSGISLSLALAMTPSSSWPVEKYYRFSYSTAPSSTATVTSSIFQSQSFSYRGVTKTVSSVTYSQSYLKVITTDGYVYEFQTASGNYYPRHTFSFMTNGESLGAYARSVLPTDDPNTHNVGASSSYDSGVSQRWSNGFFNTVDAADGIYANTINGNLVFQTISTSANIGTFPVNSMKLVRTTSSGITISFTGSCLVLSLVSGSSPSVTTASSSFTASSSGAYFLIRVV